MILCTLVVTTVVKSGFDYHTVQAMIFFLAYSAITVCLVTIFITTLQE